MAHVWDPTGEPGTYGGEGHKGDPRRDSHLRFRPVNGAVCPVVEGPPHTARLSPVDSSPVRTTYVSVQSRTGTLVFSISYRLESLDHLLIPYPSYTVSPVHPFTVPLTSRDLDDALSSPSVSGVSSFFSPRHSGVPSSRVDRDRAHRPQTTPIESRVVRETCQ